MSRHVVAAARDIPPGGRKLVTVRGRPIAVFNLVGAYYGLLNRCPHQGGSLCDGRLTGLLRSPQPGQWGGNYGRLHPMPDDRAGGADRACAPTWSSRACA